MDPDFGIGRVFQGQSVQYSSARGVLAVGQDRLLIVGTGSREGEPDFGLVTDFDVIGTGTPRNVALGSRRADNQFSGVTPRPGGGYYLFGRGNLCPDEAAPDGLLISIGTSLVDTVANCFPLEGNANGREIFPTSTEAGFAFDRQDQRFSPPSFAPVTATSQDQFCPRIAAYPRMFPDPICYEAPFLLLNSTALISPPGSVQRVRVSLGGGGAGAMDFLEIVDPPEGVVVEGNRSLVLTLSLSEQGLGSELLVEALSGLRFGVNGQTVSGGRRVVGILPASYCESRQFISFDFTMVPYLPAPFGLPADTTLCTGADLLLEGPDLPGLTYRWSTGEETRNILAAAPGNYTLRVSNGCRADSATVRVAEAMDASELMDLNVRESVCLGDSLVFVPRLEDGVTYAWADGLPGAEDRVFRAAGTYELIRTNACSAAITTVNVNFRDCCEIYLPNAFSPNGDGINDVFRAFPDTDKCGLVSNYELRVYDRWGGEVYAGETLTEGWDGGALRDQAGTGHYVYSLSYFNGLETVRRSGGVVLLR
jgi:gliding motility-associated-like protein